MEVIRECSCTADEKALKEVLRGTLGKESNMVGCLGKMSIYEKKVAVLASFIIEMRASGDMQDFTYGSEEEKQKDIQSRIKSMQDKMQKLEDDSQKEEYLLRYARAMVMGMCTEKSREHVKKYINLFAQIDSDWARKVVKRVGFDYSNIVKK